MRWSLETPPPTTERSRGLWDSRCCTVKYSPVPQTHRAFESLLQWFKNVNRKKREGKRDENKGKNGSKLTEKKDAGITVKNFAFISRRKMPGIYLDAWKTPKVTLFSRTRHFCEINTDTTKEMGFGGDGLHFRLRHRPPGGFSIHDGARSYSGANKSGQRLSHSFPPLPERLLPPLAPSTEQVLRAGHHCKCTLLVLTRGHVHWF